jgi:hypothetical protein
MWAIEITTEGCFVTYSPKLVPKQVFRVIELHSTPSLADIEKIQNYLESYNAVPIRV